MIMLRNNSLAKTTLSNKFMYNVISTEALSVHKPLAATVDKLSSFIDNVADSFKNTDILGLLDTLLSSSRKQTNAESRALDAVQRNSYADLMPVKLPCVAGQSVTWLEFLNTLEPGLRFVIDFYDNTLSQSTKFLSEVITSPDKLDSIARRYKITRIDFEELTKPIARCISGTSTRGQLPYGKLVERNGDFPQVLEITTRTSKALYNSNQDLVTERIKHIQGQLRQISSDITDPNTPYRMNSQNIDQLAKIAFNLAEGIEFYGMVLALFTEHKRTFEQACISLAKH